ncbi:MAG TPA: response regulator [Aliidongia sp.]|uniref:response regulator n=1 Tax=Aliidongia sp. TaxID=1914230 RepID=UPI002DDD80B5|nr:response regulator [Aliidongia sp.]HEV2678318.1 response regulator [Aliidongia sp.]
MPRVAEPAGRDEAAVDAAALVAAQLTAYFAALPTVLSGNLIAAFLVIWSIGGRLDRTTVWAWLAIQLVILGARLLLTSRFYRRDLGTATRPWKAAAVLGSFATGAVWGLSAFLFFVPGEIEPQAILILAICVLNTAGAGVLSTFPTAYFCSLAPCLPLLSIRLSMDGGAFQTGMAVTTAVLALALAVQGANIGRVYAHAFALRLKNEGLAARLAGQADDLRAALAQADAASRAKSDFLSTISHELRTPIHTTIGAIRLLSDTALDRMQRRCVDIIAVAGRTLQVTIDDILDFAGVDAGQAEPTVTRFRPRQIVEDVVALVLPDAGAKALDLVAMLDGALPDTLVGDESRLRQILLNLIGNAVKFTERGGIVVRGGLRPATAGAGPMLRLEIVDTGIGLGPEQQAIVFEPFVQADPSIRRRFGGTGLGLAICRRLARLSGGDVGVASRLGEGSCFWVALPVALDRAMSPPSATAMADVAGRRILVVDDEPANRFLLGELLRARGAVVVEAAGGEGALDILNRMDVDAVLMDVRMPDLDGIETTRRLRSQGGCGPRVPVLGVTANARPEDLAICRDAGMDGVVIKPVVIEQLLQALVPMLGVGDTVFPESPPTGLSRLVEDLGPDVAARLLETARGSLAQSDAALAAAIALGDAARIAAAAHRLAGLAASARLDALCVLAEKMESAARDGLDQELSSLIPHLPQAIATADAVLGETLAVIARDRRAAD